MDEVHSIYDKYYKFNERESEAQPEVGHGSPNNTLALQKVQCWRIAANMRPLGNAPPGNWSLRFFMLAASEDMAATVEEAGGT